MRHAYHPKAKPARGMPLQSTPIVSMAGTLSGSCVNIPQAKNMAVMMTTNAAKRGLLILCNAVYCHDFRRGGRLLIGDAYPESRACVNFTFNLNATVMRLNDLLGDG